MHTWDILLVVIFLSISAELYRLLNECRLNVRKPSPAQLLPVHYQVAEASNEIRLYFKGLQGRACAEILKIVRDAASRKMPPPFFAKNGGQTFDVTNFIRKAIEMSAFASMRGQVVAD